MSTARFNTWEALDGSKSLNIDDVASQVDLNTITAIVNAMSTQGFALVKNFASLAAALASAATHLVFTEPVAVTSTATWPSTKTYEFMRGGSLAVSAGVTLTIRGVVKAPGVQIFTGAGSVIGLRYNRPEWWGAVGDGTTECAAALNAASASVNASLASAGGRPTIELPSGQLLVSNTWTVNPSADINLLVKGQGTIFSGTRLVASTSFPAAPVMYMPGSADSTQKIADFHLQDFGIVPKTVGAGGATVGLKLGSTGTTLIALQENKVENLYIANLPTGIQLVNTRLTHFSRCAVWNDGLSTQSTCLHLKADSNFCGDSTFANCQFVNKHTVTGSMNIYLETQYGSYASNNLNQLAGVRFIECIIYPAYKAVKGFCGAGSWLTDVFFTNCQWDGNSYQMMDFEANNSGSMIRDVYLTNNYMYGGNMSATLDGVIFQATGTGASVRNLHISGNTFGQCVGRCFNAYGCIGVTFTDNILYEFNNNNGTAVEFGGNSSRLTVIGNRMDRSAGVFSPYMIQLNSGCDRYIVMGNLGNGIVSSATIRDLATSGNSIVVNNL